MTDSFPDFRPGNVLATRFTGTLSERHGDAVERIPVAQRVLDWLRLNGLSVQSCSTAELHAAHELREAIHLCATAAASGESLPLTAVSLINASSAGGRAAAVLAPEGTRSWQLSVRPTVEDALSVVADDAISLLAGERSGRLAICASLSCRAVFLDTSQSRTRRWCDMNTCGNRNKKARYRAQHH